MSSFELPCSVCGKPIVLEAMAGFPSLRPTKAIHEACRPAEAKTDNFAERWEKVCPPLYRQTDPNRLDKTLLTKVLSWKYGPQGLLLVGPTSKGKTRCAYLLLQRLLKEGREVKAFDCVEFGHKCGTEFGNGTGDAWMKRLTEVDVVFLDDLGKCVFTDRVESELFALVERRAANMKPLIVTTNHKGAALSAMLSIDRAAPLIRRLREFCQVVEFK